MLSAEQQKLINDSLWIVNTVLKKFNLQRDEDMRQEAIVYLCSCVERFDQNRNVKWSTYAYSNIYWFIARRKQEEQEHVKNTMHLSALPDDMGDNLQSATRKINIDTVQLLSEVATLCTPTEKHILYLKYKGYTTPEIAQIGNLTVAHTSYILTKIRKKINNVINNYEK